MIFDQSHLDWQMIITQLIGIDAEDDAPPESSSSGRGGRFPIMRMEKRRQKKGQGNLRH